MQRPQFENTRHQLLMDDFISKINNLNTQQTEDVLTELMADPIYSNPTHPDHAVYLHMVPTALAKQEALEDVGSQVQTDVTSPQEAQYLKSLNGAEQILNTLRENKALPEDIARAQQTVEFAKEAHSNYLIEVETVKKIDAEHQTQRDEQTNLKQAEAKQRFIGNALAGVPLEEHAGRMPIIESDWKKHEHLFG